MEEKRIPWIAGKEYPVIALGEWEKGDLSAEKEFTELDKMA